MQIYTTVWNNYVNADITISGDDLILKTGTPFKDKQFQIIASTDSLITETIIALIEVCGSETVSAIVATEKVFKYLKNSNSGTALI